MPLNPNIALQIRPPEIESPLNTLARVSQVQNAMNQNRLADLAFGEKEREIADRGLVRNALMTAGGDYKSAQNALMSQGLYKQAMEIGKSRLEMDRGEADLKKTRGEISKQDHEMKMAKYKFAIQNSAALLADPDLTYDKVVANAEQAVSAGMLDPEVMAAQLPSLPRDPVQLRAHLQKGLLSVLTAEQQLAAVAPKIEFKDTGGQIVGVQNNPNLPGYLEPVTTLKKTMTPGEIATNARGVEANRLKAQENSIIGGKQAFEAEGKLADDHRAQSKTFVGIRDAYKRLSAALPNATTSAAATLAGATTFMKLLDPGSVVRESELGMALAATGAFDRAANYFNTLQNGKVLTASQAKDFQNIADQLYKAAEQSQSQIDRDFTERAGRYGLNPKNIIGTYRANDAGGGAPTNKPSLDSFFRK